MRVQGTLHGKKNTSSNGSPEDLVDSPMQVITELIEITVHPPRAYGPRASDYKPATSLLEML